MFPEFAGCLWVGVIHLLVCALLLCGLVSGLDCGFGGV